MGNTFSSPNQPMDIKSLSSHIDDIAIHYILKQNTIDLLRLTDKEYYDNLIVLVSNLFDRRLSDMEVGSIHQRIFPETVQNAVLSLLPTTGKMKDNMINGISKFYIKIMMIFSAIVATIDPQYSYEDNNGEKQLFYLKDIHSYKNIPKNVQPMVHQLTNPMNLCRKRISILRNKLDSSDPDFITINPGEKICSTDSTNHLTDEIGIKELDLLYYDVFDTKSKTWKSRSKEMEEKYKEDLKMFYMVFTGKSEMPENIKSFKDIELFDFKKIGYCSDNLFTHDFIISKDNQLILRYKEQVDLLEQSTSKYRSDLIAIIKRIFLTKIENENTSYTIRPTLTLDDILQIEKDTRTTIIDLYTNCEKYFIRALLIFEELYDSQSKLVNESRSNYLDNRPLYTENMIHSNNRNWMNEPKPVPLFPEPDIPEPMPLTKNVKNSTSISNNMLPFGVPTIPDKNQVFSMKEPFTQGPIAPTPFAQPISQPATFSQPQPNPFLKPPDSLMQAEPNPLLKPPSDSLMQAETKPTDSFMQPIPKPPDSFMQPQPNPPDSFMQPIPKPPETLMQTESNPLLKPPSDSLMQPQPNPPDSFMQPIPKPSETLMQTESNPLLKPPSDSLMQPQPNQPDSFMQPIPKPHETLMQPETNPLLKPPSESLMQPQPKPPDSFIQPQPNPSETLMQPETNPLSKPPETLMQTESNPLLKPPSDSLMQSQPKPPDANPILNPSNGPVPFTNPTPNRQNPPSPPFTQPLANPFLKPPNETVPPPFTLPSQSNPLTQPVTTEQKNIPKLKEVVNKPEETKPTEDKTKEESILQKISNMINGNTNPKK